MSESFRTRLTRLAYNLIPAYRGTGARITYISSDFREIRIALPLNWRTRNYVGTIFGGSMFAAVDPIYMVMLIRNLGSEYSVWDKAATIQFRKPGRSTLRATFRITPDELEAIRLALASNRSIERTYGILLADDEGTVCASVVKTIHIRKKSASGNPS